MKEQHLVQEHMSYTRTAHEHTWETQEQDANRTWTTHEQTWGRARNHEGAAQYRWNSCHKTVIYMNPVEGTQFQNMHLKCGKFQNRHLSCKRSKKKTELQVPEYAPKLQKFQNMHLSYRSSRICTKKMGAKRSKICTSRVHIPKYTPKLRGVFQNIHL